MKSEKLFTDNNWNRKQNDAFKCFADSLFFRRPTEGIVTPLVFLMRLLSYRIRKKAKRLKVSYSFLFMRASGDQLREITSLIDSGIIRPIVDKVFPFEETNEALAYVEKGRAKGKVVVKVRLRSKLR